MRIGLTRFNMIATLGGPGTPFGILSPWLLWHRAGETQSAANAQVRAAHTSGFSRTGGFQTRLE